MSHIDNIREIEDKEFWSVRDKVRFKHGYLKALKETQKNWLEDDDPLTKVNEAIKEAEND